MSKLKNEIKDIKTKLDRPVALIGMMGAGKSFLGRALANSLSVEFADSDSVIEGRAGITASEIFDHYGEEKFRDFEFKVIDELTGKGPLILSTGGGAPTHAATMDILLERCIVIWLNAELDLMWSRVEQSKTRPLLQTENPKETLAKLLEKRKELYAKAHTSLDISFKNADKAEKNLIKALYEFLNKDSV